MNPATITAITTAVVSVITAVGTLIRQFQHEKNTAAQLASNQTPPA